jgi:hypothetical protein
MCRHVSRVMPIQAERGKPETSRRICPLASLRGSHGRLLIVGSLLSGGTFFRQSRIDSKTALADKEARWDEPQCWV